MGLDFRCSVISLRSIPVFVFTAHFATAGMEQRTMTALAGAGKVLALPRPNPPPERERTVLLIPFSKLEAFVVGREDFVFPNDSEDAAWFGGIDDG